MIVHRRIAVRLAPVTCVVAFAAVACGPITPKIAAERSTDAVSFAIQTAQDAELALYCDDPTTAARTGRPCAPSNAHPEITLVKHQDFHAALTKAFKAEGEAWQQIKNWHGGDLPKSFDEVVAATNGALAIVKSFGTEKTQHLIGLVQAILDRVAELKRRLTGGGDPIDAIPVLFLIAISEEELLRYILLLERIYQSFRAHFKQQGLTDEEIDARIAEAKRRERVSEIESGVASDDGA